MTDIRRTHIYTRSIICTRSLIYMYTRFSSHLYWIYLFSTSIPDSFLSSIPNLYIPHLYPIFFYPICTRFYLSSRSIPDSHLLSIDFYSICKSPIYTGVGSFQCRGVLRIWTPLGQGPTVLAVVAGWGCLDIIISLFFLRLSWKRLKYCHRAVKPKTTNQPDCNSFIFYFHRILNSSV